MNRNEQKIKKIDKWNCGSFEKNGVDYYKCSICGAWTRYNDGIYMEYKFPRLTEGFVRRACCYDCTKEYIEPFFKHLDIFLDEKRETRIKHKEKTEEINKAMKTLFSEISLDMIKLEIDWSESE